jgi:hypothetical protein
MNTRRLIILIALLIQAGCTMWQRVDSARAEAPDNAYSVELPLGWMRFMQETNGIALTRDGFDLNRIRIQRRDLDKAFPNLKKAALASMLPSELAELQIAEVKSEARDTVVTVKDNAPAMLGERVAYRLHLTYKNDRGLTFDRVIYGVATSKGYFTLGFTAPALYYSARELPTFEKVVGSFKLTSSQ